MAIENTLDRLEDIPKEPRQKDESPEKEEKTRSILDEPMTRRQFLEGLVRTATAAAVTSAAAKVIPEILQDEQLTVPETLQGTEIYGLRERIHSISQIRRLYAHLDKRFAKEHKLPPSEAQHKPKETLRKENLPSNERYLEVLVPRSVYQRHEIEGRQGGRNFVEYIQEHIEAMNLFLANAKPASKMQVALRRIIVIEDSFAERLYNREEKDTLGQNLDHQWIARNRRQLLDLFPIDIDTSWAIAEYNTHENPDTEPYTWRYTYWRGNLYFRKDQKGKYLYAYPSERTPLLRKRQEGIIDCALIHEWSHVLTNLPDEYLFDARPEGSVFPGGFFFATGNFVEPHLSPYLAMLANRHVEEKRRTSYREHFEKGFSMRDMPSKVSIKIKSRDNSSWQLHFVPKQQHEEILEEPPSLIAHSEGFSFDRRIGAGIQGDAMGVLITDRTKETQIYLPYAALNMSYMAKLEEANYEIELLEGARENHSNPIAEKDQTLKHAQLVRPIPQDELETFLAGLRKKGKVPYAKMRVDGTSIWFVWWTTNV